MPRISSGADQLMHGQAGGDGDGLGKICDAAGEIARAEGVIGFSFEPAFAGRKRQLARDDFCESTVGCASAAVRRAGYTRTHTTWEDREMTMGSHEGEREFLHFYSISYNTYHLNYFLNLLVVVIFYNL